MMSMTCLGMFSLVREKIQDFIPPLLFIGTWHNLAYPSQQRPNLYFPFMLSNPAVRVSRRTCSLPSFIRRRHCFLSLYWTDEYQRPREMFHRCTAHIGSVNEWHPRRSEYSMTRTTCSPVRHYLFLWQLQAFTYWCLIECSFEWSCKSLYVYN